MKKSLSIHPENPPGRFPGKWRKQLSGWLFIGVLGLAIHLGSAMLRLNTFWPYPKLVDFGSFYGGALALAHQHSPYAPSSDFSRILVDAGLQIGISSLNSFPVWPWMLRPAALLPFPLAAWLWLLLNLLILMWCTRELASLMRMTSFPSQIALYLVVLFFGPVMLTLTLGQSSILLLALALLIGRGLERSSLLREIITGVFWVAGVSTKLFPLLWLPGLFLLRRWRALITGITAIMALISLHAIFLPRLSQTYLLTYLPQRATRLSSGSLDDQSLLAWLLRLTQPLTFQTPGLFAFQRQQLSWRPYMVVDPNVIWWIAFTLLGIAGGWLSWRLWLSDEEQATPLFYLWALFVLLILPHTERYNHVLLLPAMAWLWGQGGRGIHFAILGYFLSGLARLTHLWVLILPWPLAPLATGFGVSAVLTLMGGMIILLNLRQRPIFSSVFP